MTFIDFAALKQDVAIESVLSVLGLQMKEYQGQWRGPCPTCKTGGKRALVVTASCQAFYCFGGRTGGDVIALVAHIHGCSMKKAAEFLSDRNGQGSGRKQSEDTVPEERGKEDARSLQPLNYLQPDHTSVENLGLSKDCCVHFSAGYAPKGIMRGRLAIPIHDQDGKLIAYCGLAVDGKSPELIFPSGFDPTAWIFNCNRIENGSREIVTIVRDPRDVMHAWQNGITNTICFLTESISPEQLDLLSAFLKKSQCTQLEFA